MHSKSLMLKFTQKWLLCSLIQPDFIVSESLNPLKSNALLRKVYIAILHFEKENFFLRFSSDNKREFIICNFIPNTRYIRWQAVRNRPPSPHPKSALYSCLLSCHKKYLMYHFLYLFLRIQVAPFSIINTVSTYSMHTPLENVFLLRRGTHWRESNRARYKNKENLK